MSPITRGSHADNDTRSLGHDLRGSFHAGAMSQPALYPNRVVKFIVPVAAGGTVDIVARRHLRSA